MTDQQFYSILSQAMPDFTPVERIGAGSYGSVFKCERDGMYYAIKIIPIPAGENELQMLFSRYDKEGVQELLDNSVENYRREIKLMSELKGNRNIVNIEDYKIVNAEEHLGYYIVIRMELLTSLVNYTAEHTLTREQIITLGIDICEALTICEKHNIVHRDIKPENIMLHNDGAFKLGDFGVAKQMSKTTVGTIAGTEGFMAPEVSKGLEYNHTADIYSLGILLYYYLNNRKMPYVDPENKSSIADQNAIAKRMNTDEILPFPPNTDENLGKIVLKACMYDRTRRYQSARIMKRDLIMVLHGEDVDINLEETGLEVETGGGTHGGTIGPDWGNPPKPPVGTPGNSGNGGTGEIPPEPPKKKKKTGLIIGVAVAVLAVGGIGLGVVTGMQDKPTTYVDSQGNTVQALSRNEMEDAYTLGMQYYEQGNYESAIAELNKVTNKSGKYEEAQAAMVSAMTAYKDGLIEKSESYCASGNFEMALSILESGTALLGDNNDLMVQQKNVLNQLKIDHINKASDAEQSGDYATAYSYVQTALAFLPDDIELEGLYSRLEAMTAMTTALQDAENYAVMEDYAKLFSSLEDAMNDVRGSTTASSKIKLAYDEYKKSFLNDIEAQIKNPTTVDEYSRAIDALNAAVEIFPDEYELKRKQESLQLMKTALNAIIKAEDYYRSSEYKDMFASLETAMQEVSADKDAQKKVEDTYEAYRKEYLEDLYSSIGEPRTVTDYDNAIVLLEAALKDIPNDNELQSKLDDMIAYKPIDMLSTSIASAMTFGGDTRINYAEWEKATIYDETAEMNLYRYVYTGSYKDSYGTLHQNSILLRTYSYSSWATYVIYDCEKFGSLSGNISVYEDSKSYAGNLYVEIYGIMDDMTENLIYRKAFVSGIKPQEIDLDVTGYSSIKLQIINYNKDGSEWQHHGVWRDQSGIIFSDFVLSK